MTSILALDTRGLHLYVSMKTTSYEVPSPSHCAAGTAGGTTASGRSVKAHSSGATLAPSDVPTQRVRAAPLLRGPIALEALS